jgi:stage V sporulation protein D (sporulation-specific penicillin-binding protein)
MMLGVQRFYKYLRDFGFTGRTGIDLPGEARRPNILRPENLATPLDVAEEAFGQTLAVTPLSMLTAISAIANGGELMWPHIGMDLRTPDGRLLQRIAPRGVRRVLSPQVAYTVQSLMASVVEQGSGKNAAISCYSIAGKTGTTQKYVGGRIGEGMYIGSFLGFAPAHGARVALYVMIDEPQGLYYGGQVAAPVFRTIMIDALRYLGVQAACPPGQKPPVAGALPAETVTMPDIVGLSPTDAERVAAEAGLFLDVQEGGTTGAAGGRVLRQVPPSGTAVTKWATVLGYTTPALALPEQTVTVPDLRGLTVQQSAAALGVEGLQLQADGTGHVVAQNPVPGMALHPGDVVRVMLR